jgi:cytidylate kinase
MEKGFSAKLQEILQDLEDRDARDAARPVAPLRQEADARLLETSDLTIAQAVDQVLGWSGNKA